MIRLPRNMPFLEKLPKRFYLRVLKARNRIPEGRWYYVEINEHQLNLLSETELNEGELLEIEKEGQLSLRIVQQLETPESSSISDLKAKQVDISI